MSQQPWFPTIISEECNSCRGAYKCVNFCPNDVLEIREEKVFVVNPLSCVYGCSTCASFCPKDAIIFPSEKGPIRYIKKKSWLHEVTCKICGKKFLTDRNTEYCFDCQK